MPRLIAVLTSVWIALATPPAIANTQTDCTQTEDWWLRIQACTDAIDSPNWTGARVAWAYSNRAVAHAELGNYLSAFDDHRKAVALNPTDPAARNNKANSHARFREYDRAVAEYSAAIRLRPDYTNALFNRADTYLSMGDYPAAVQDYSAVVQADADAAAAWAGRAEARCQLGETETSLQDRVRALELGVPAVEEMAGYLVETGYLRAPQTGATLADIQPALNDWTAAGCP